MPLRGKPPPSPGTGFLEFTTLGMLSVCRVPRIVSSEESLQLLVKALPSAPVIRFEEDVSH